MRKRLLLSSTAALLLVMMPFEAMAQAPADPGNVSVRDRARPEYDPIGIQLGGFDLKGTLGIDGTSDDNVFATPANEKSDTLLTTQEVATLASHWSRHSLAFSASGAQNHYSSLDSDNTDDSHFGVDGRLDILTASEAGAGASFDQLHDPRTDPDAPNNVAEPVQYTLDTQYAYFRHAFNRFRISGRYTHSQYDYDDTPLTGGGVLDQDFRDHDESIGNARVEVALSPRIAFFGDATVNNRDYKNNGLLNLDSNGHVYAVGVSFNITAVMQGEFSIGSYNQDYKDPAIGHLSGTTYNGHVQWFPTELTTVSFNVNRGVEESATPGASFLHTQASVRVDHELLRNVILTAGLSEGKLEYSGINRTDDTTVADVGAEYLVNRRVRLHAGYEFDRDNSNLPGQDFDVNRFTVGIAFHL